ncbi:hypothetical protein [Nocardiopsis sp. NPDC006832]|uniref:hypothetical protein n=1 Tax=Nocardiopsis sp. NPDC006832 TaxID=3157188 RepID=UPI0033CD38DF
MTTQRKWRRRALWSAACALGVGGLLLSGATAVQSADPADLCSDAHPEVGQVPRYTQVADGWPDGVPGDPGGQVHLFYESTGGYNCAVVVSNGGPARMDIGIRADGVAPQTSVVESGTVAGPVLVHAPGVCVQVTAAVGERSTLFPSGNCNE